MPVEGGYNLSGRWNFSSGSRHATWALAIAPISGRIGSNGSDSKEMRDMFIPNNEVDWVDTWDVNGLRGTGSFSFTVNDKFVPEENTYVLGGPPVAEGPLYLFSRTLLFCAGFATTALGAARSSIDSLIGDTSSRTPHAISLYFHYKEYRFPFLHLTNQCTLKKQIFLLYFQYYHSFGFTIIFSICSSEA